MRYILLFIFLIITLLTTFITLEAKNLLQLQNKHPLQLETRTPQVVSQTAALYFTPPSTHYADLSKPMQTTIMINSGNTEVSEIQIELKYNPKTLTFLNASVPDHMFLGNPDNFTVAFNESDPQRGRISLAIKTKPSGHPKKGVGTVAILYFLPKSISDSMITFTPASSVSSPYSSASILEKTTNATFSYEPLSTTSAVLSITPLP